MVYIFVIGIFSIRLYFLKMEGRKEKIRSILQLFFDKGKNTNRAAET